MTIGKVKDFNFSSKGYAKGGKVVEKATGESYPSRKAMMKQESMETPRMQRKEVVQRETVKASAAPQGMLRNRGTLGVMANKNPGETRMNTAPNLPGEKMMMNKGGKAMMGGGSTHAMPDGKMMKNSAMKKGGMAKKC
jgi:hypothetical protein